METSPQSHKSEGKRKKKRMKSKRIKGNPLLTLVSQTFSEGVLEYVVRNKGFSQPFAKVRAVFTSEMMDKGEVAVKDFIGKVLRLKILDTRNCFRASSQSQMD
ncbi:hypothetical protein Bca4012_061164 [Brassica carinata]